MSSSKLDTTTAALTTVFREARHIAGGLVHHPVESTKHFSILRHSVGLVYYRGPTTSLTITIFSSLDHPLPADRTLWLQPKGWLGKSGWRAKSLIGFEGDWLNVTPVTRAGPDQVKPSDERAWQRDIKYFLQKGPGGSSRKHVVRETEIIRIPAEATDGYFRIVLCTGPEGKRKTLCPSPEFRVASTSASPSSIRGASLGALPLELGAKVVSSFTTGQIGAIAGTVTAPITGAVQTYAQQVQPGFVAQEALTTGYSASGFEDRVSNAVTNAGAAYDAARDSMYAPVTGRASDDNMVEVVGPQAPYPIHLKGEVVSGTGNSTATTSLPTANLKTLPDDLAYRLYGYYFGWSRICEIIPATSSAQPTGSIAAVTFLESKWYESIISVLPRQTGKSISVVHGIKKIAAVHLIHDIGHGLNLVGATLEVLILGFLRPPPPSPALLDVPQQGKHTSPGAVVSPSMIQKLSNMQTQEIRQPNSFQHSHSIEEAKEAALLAAIDDVAVTQASLLESGWRIEDFTDPQTGKLLTRAKSQTLPGKVTHAYVGARQGVQKQIDRVPLHLVGIRAGVDG